jgi:hypothetical protein
MMTMDKKQREVLIDEILIFSNDEIEQIGDPIQTVSFNFQEDGEDAINFLKTHNLSYADLSTALNACITRGYFKKRAMTAQRYMPIALTEEGQGRAISTDLAKHSPTAKEDATGSVTIGTLNTHGATQIGSHNTQQIENVFNSIVEQIDQADAPEAEKMEAKSRLSSFLEHPLAGTILGMTPMAIKALCGGG